MIRTSNYTNLTASITGRGKRGLFALGEVAQKKLYTAEYVPSSAGEPGLIFTLLPLPLAAAGFPLSLPGMAHSATVGSGIIDPRVASKCHTERQSGQLCGAASDRRPGSRCATR
jgi:hypothetical protein